MRPWGMGLVPSMSFPRGPRAYDQPLLRRSMAEIGHSAVPATQFWAPPPKTRPQSSYQVEPTCHQRLSCTLATGYQPASSVRWVRPAMVGTPPLGPAASASKGLKCHVWAGGTPRELSHTQGREAHGKGRGGAGSPRISLPLCRRWHFATCEGMRPHSVQAVGCGQPAGAVPGWRVSGRHCPQWASPCWGSQAAVQPSRFHPAGSPSLGL